MAARFLLRSVVFLAILSTTTPSTFPQPQPQPIPEPELKPSDTDALTIFRHAADTHGILSSNWTTPDACSGRWLGVLCSSTSGEHRVTSLTLPSLDLRGPLDALSHLTELRALDLRGNRINGTLEPLLRGARGLVLLYLSGNDVSGPIPAAADGVLAGLTRLARLDLADNSLVGELPSAAEFAKLTALVAVRLQDNLLTGLVPDLGAAALPGLVEFNVSNNRLSGRVPDGMRARFGVASFAGNSGLCGPAPPLPPCSFLPREPTPPSSSSSAVPSVVPSNPASSVASSSPALATPESLGGAGDGGGGGTRRTTTAGLRLSPGAVAGIAVGNALFFLALASLLLACCCCGRRGGAGEPATKKRKRRGRVGLEDGGGGGSLFGHLKGESHHHQQQPARPGSAGRCSDGDGGDSDGARSKLVFFDASSSSSSDDGAPLTSHLQHLQHHHHHQHHHQQQQQQGRSSGRFFELEELLRASAEMVGRGSLGTVYRAVLGDGRMVAVKRLRDANPCPRAEFRRYMDLVGRLRHPHLVPLRAFYYARQEKLLVYDFLPLGNLHLLLHGGGEEKVVDWGTRVRMVRGAARGLAWIHGEHRETGVPHGNVKATNVLVDEGGEARVADFGLALLLSPAHAIARLGGYMAPEQAHDKRLSQEADVYSFGVLLLEVLTGKAPAAMEGMGLAEWVRSVVREEWTAEVFDVGLLRCGGGGGGGGVEEEMVAMLHVALACVAARPEERPGMGEVVRMIESVRGEVEQDDREQSSSSAAAAAAAGDDEDVDVTSPSIGVTTTDDDGF